jgi:2-amino-4-hydroxy-6-hydroxymethyldihydropteridine diphosphokinase
MSLIIATGSNLGDKEHHLNQAKEKLKEHFKFVAASNIYASEAVDYQDQPDFYNQVLEFEIPSMQPVDAMNLLLEIEKNFGRVRDIDKGPRIIDLDIIFWGEEKVDIPDKLHIPHPRWMSRSFVAKPLSELPFFQTLKKCFTIPSTFDVEAFPINKTKE